MTSQNAIKEVVILGGGTAGWMSASLLAKLLGDQLSITLVESEDIGTVGVGEATIPPIMHFNAALGIDENAFLSATHGSMKLGIQFENWGQVGDSYMHAFGDIGKGLGMTSFHQYWRRFKASNPNSDFWDFSLNFQAAKNKKFQKTTSNQPFNSLAYAYHFDAGLYAKFLRQFCEQHGVKRVEGKVDSVQTESNTGNIAGLTLSTGQQIKGDFFIDCSGFKGLLIEETLNTGYENWQHWLPCDRAMALQTTNDGDIEPYTRSIAHHSGWRWHIPLQHRTGNGLVYSSQYMNDDDAESFLRKEVTGEALTQVRKIPFVTGRRKKQWSHNVVALGLSSGFLEPLESTSLHLIQTGIIRLVKLFPQTQDDLSNATEFNRLSQVEMEKIRDFIILHYHLNQRQDSPFWKNCQTMDIPESLQRRIQLFKQQGMVFREQEELFAEVAWQQVFIGQNLMPSGWQTLANNISDAQLSGFMQDVQTIIRQNTSAMSGHSDYLKNNCAK